MSTTELVRAVMLGALAMGAWVVGLFFFRFWRMTRDRLFLMFGASFWILAAHWLVLTWAAYTEEARSPIYAMRLVAFLLIIVAILDKNRKPPP
jgi:hypothetical protein